MISNDGKPGELGYEALENLSTAVILLDRYLHLRYLNGAAEALLASSRRKALQHHLHELLLESEALMNKLRESLLSGRSITERELTLSLVDGSRRTVDCTIAPIPDAKDNAAVLLEMQILDRHLRISREEQLLSQQQASSALMRGLAHEIRNPLGGLRGAAQLLERELNGEELREYTQVIISEADRLEGLVNRMLGPRGNRAKEPTNIHHALERVRVLVQAEVAEGVGITSRYDPSIPPVVAAEDQLIQALLNIVRNAAQALGETGEIVLETRIERRFTIGPRTHRLVARIDIIDNGPGIPAHMVEQIFYPMVTGRADGSGLGLPIAQSIINQHGGLIECASAPQRTVFTVRLPLEEQ